MRVRPSEIWDWLNTSYWFVPSVMAAGALGLAFAAVALDEAAPVGAIRQLNWVYRGGPEGAAGVLTAIAGSMITIAGLVFSLTLVTLSLASSQFGPRLLRNFIRDRLTQVVMGTFLGVFLYCLFVLRTIRRADGSEFVPHVSVTLGVVFAVASLVVLIYFIHHLATSIQADTLVARVSEELAAAITRLYPDEIGTVPPRPAPPLPAGEGAAVPCDGDGYIQAVEADAILRIAVENDLVVRLDRRPGHYVLAGLPVARVWPPERATAEVTRAVAATFIRGPVRTPTQDAEFIVNQLVEVAVRALSPGINDPFTAITCIDRLASGLARVARREVPSPLRLGDDGRLRVIAEPVTFPALLDAAFNQIRQYGRTSAAVLIRLLEVIADLTAVATRASDRAALARHTQMVARAAHDGLTEGNDRRDVEERVAAIARSLAVAQSP
jgi:uncharacterized membrane protein